MLLWSNQMGQQAAALQWVIRASTLAKVFGRRIARGQAIGVCGLVLAWAAPTAASVELRGFSDEEWSALGKGAVVERRFELPHHGAKYLSAVSYGVLEQPCELAMGLWKNPSKHLAKALPATRRVDLVAPDVAQPSLTRLRIEHGNAMMQGSWGAVYRISGDGMLAQFWLDAKVPSDVKDVFGYLRLSRWSSHQCLVTAAIAVDTGDGLLASLFSSTIHTYLVRTAARIQRYVQSGDFSG
jgi:hypothetical protein